MDKISRKKISLAFVKMTWRLKNLENSDITLTVLIFAFFNPFSEKGNGRITKTHAAKWGVLAWKGFIFNLKKSLLTAKISSAKISTFKVSTKKLFFNHWSTLKIINPKLVFLNTLNAWLKIKYLRTKLNAISAKSCFCLIKLLETRFIKTL